MTMENSKPTKTKTESVSIEDIFGAQTPMESQLEKVTPEDAGATSIEQVKFQFRDIIEPEKRKVLAERAPKVAKAMVEDHNQILSFGGSVLDEMNQTSTRILNNQKEIKIPEIDDLINGTLRELDGFKKKYKNAKVEKNTNKLVQFFRGTKYSLEAMVRETKPLLERIEMVETQIMVTENKLRENVARGQELHNQTLEGLKKVVDVLAALEEIQEVVRKEFNEADELIKAQTATEGEISSVTWKGESISINELHQIHADLAEGMSEIEKTWFEWRQQFFIGYAQAPSVRNIASVSMQMQRHMFRFRTQAIPATKQSLAMLQQAIIVDEATKLGDAVHELTNSAIQEAYKQSADVVKRASASSEKQNITPETILTITESIQEQFTGMVEAAKNGRAARLEGLEIMSKSEQTINQAVIKARQDMAKELMSAAQSNTNMIEGNKGASNGLDHIFK